MPRLLYVALAAAALLARASAAATTTSTKSASPSAKWSPTATACASASLTLTASASASAVSPGASASTAASETPTATATASSTATATASAAVAPVGACAPPGCTTPTLTLGWPVTASGTTVAGAGAAASTAVAAWPFLRAPLAVALPAAPGAGETVTVTCAPAAGDASVFVVAAPGGGLGACAAAPPAGGACARADSTAAAGTTARFFVVARAPTTLDGSSAAPPGTITCTVASAGGAAPRYAASTIFSAPTRVLTSTWPLVGAVLAEDNAVPGLFTGVAGAGAGRAFRLSAANVSAGGAELAPACAGLLTAGAAANGTARVAWANATLPRCAAALAALGRVAAAATAAGGPPSLALSAGDVTHLLLVPSRGAAAFPAGLTATLGGAPCAVNWVAPDGAVASVSTPALEAICAARGAPAGASDCGSVQLVLAGAPWAAAAAAIAAAAGDGAGVAVVATYTLGLTMPPTATGAALAALTTSSVFSALRADTAAVAGVQPSAVFLVAVQDGATGELLASFSRAAAPNSYAARRAAGAAAPAPRAAYVSTTVTSLSLGMQVEGTASTLAAVSAGLVGAPAAALKATFSRFWGGFQATTGVEGTYGIAPVTGVYAISPSATQAPLAISSTSTASLSSTMTATATATATATTASAFSCAAGSYNLGGGTTAAACRACSAGSYSAVGAAACSTCAANTYSIGGASSCTACGTGLTSPAGSTSVGACTPIINYMSIGNIGTTYQLVIGETAYFASQQTQLYADNTAYFQRISAPPGLRLNLQFTSIDTESNYDFMSLSCAVNAYTTTVRYKGIAEKCRTNFDDLWLCYSGSNPLIDHFTATNTPSLNSYYWCGGTLMTVQLLTDISDRRTGITFKAWSE